MQKESYFELVVGLFHQLKCEYDSQNRVALRKARKIAIHKNELSERLNRLKSNLFSKSNQL